MKTGAKIRLKSEDEAVDSLMKAVRSFTKECRWFPYGSKINQLRKPLIELEIARKERGGK